MKSVKSEEFNWDSVEYATTENTKVGDSVIVVRHGINTLWVSDGVVTKITKTTMHVKYDSGYCDANGFHPVVSNHIFRRHTHGWDSFEYSRETVYVKVDGVSA